jgi:transcriptional regulator
MYVPESFQMPDPRAEGLKLAGEHPFATLVTMAPGGVHVDHVPLLVEWKAGEPRVLGHFSRKNPHAAALAQAGESLAVFHGPHAYISPRWYAEYDVATWNYAVAHVRGRVRLIEDDRGLTAIVGALTARFEAPLGGIGGPLIPEDLKGDGVLGRAIVGFELSELQVEVKMKLNQNRPLADREGAIAGLERTGDPGARQLAALMRRVNGL